MIIGKETNQVFLSQILDTDPQFHKTCHALIQILDKHAINHDFLQSTKDVWCRDYMPIQTGENKYVQFRYEPSYLEGYRHTQSNTKEVCKTNNIKPQCSNINLDGGNIVNWSDVAIITDRVFDENPQQLNKAKLVAEIEKLLEVEVIIIPQTYSDMTGHADGHVRFIDRHTLIGNDREMEYKYWKNGVNKILQQKGIDYIDIPLLLDHKVKGFPDHAIGCYVNYLEIGNLIVLPIFEIENNKDQEVYDTFTTLFPDRTIETINYNDIGLHGGLLNCSTWTIQDKAKK